MGDDTNSTLGLQELMGDDTNNTWDLLEHMDVYLKDELEKIESRDKPGTDNNTKTTIFKVPTQFDQNYVSACSPTNISIGPYHRREPKLRCMEAYKWHYFNELMKRRQSRLPMKDFVASLHMEMKIIENDARSCYSEVINNIKSADFVEMMLLDGCFIIEFMFRLQPGNPTPIISTSYRWLFVLLDLLTVENQLPFFVLQSIYNMVVSRQSSTEGQTGNSLNENGAGQTIELIDILVNVFSSRENRLFLHLTKPQRYPDHLLHLFYLAVIGNETPPPNTPQQQELMNARLYRTATELNFSGVKIKKKDDQRLLNVMFDSGVIEMSPLVLNEYTNVLLRNFVALEQCEIKYGLYFSSYVTFIDQLIGSNKDVELLVKRRIYYNMMGSNEDAVKHYFNRLSNDIVIDRSHHLLPILLKMDKYCKKTLPKWRASLFRDYFNSPWSILSFVAAFLLVVLTMLQASATIKRYINHST